MDVREAIRDEFVGLGDDFELDLTTEPGWVTCSLNRADRILALIVEALLSDEVYEATARKVIAEDPSNADTWEALSPYMQEVMVAYARSHAIAAIAATGLGGQGDE